MTRLWPLLLAIIAEPSWADEWRTQDTVLEVAWQALNLVDMGTTLDMAKRNEDYTEVTNRSGEVYRVQAYDRTYVEQNPIIGHRPDKDRIVLTMTAGAVAHAAISYWLPHGWRDGWQIVTIGTSGYYVRHNLSVGLKVNF